MWLLFFGGDLYLALCSALLCLTINSFPYMRNFASSVLQNYPENNKLSRTAFGFSWELLPPWQLQTGAFLVQRGTTVPKEPG